MTGFKAFWFLLARKICRTLLRWPQLSFTWERVSTNLADHWTLAKLAKEAGYSNEHLRRLCQRQLGRSPMHQVTNLRMRRAAELLAATDRTIESIALEVGYHTPFVFSNAFTKWIGWRPSEYRRKKQDASIQNARYPNRKIR